MGLKIFQVGGRSLELEALMSIFDEVVREHVTGEVQVGKMNGSE